ncbi:MAG: thioesterase family protein [Bacteroidota bacterium]
MTEAENDRRLMLVEIPIRIYGYDIDVMGIVSNQVYVRWFEDLRTEFLARYWPYEQMLEDNISPVLARTEVDYKYPLTIHDQVQGSLWVEEFTRAKWIMNFEIASEKRIFCLGKQMGYVVELNRKRPVPMPTGLMEKYELAKKKIESA